jgi:hypothetical protein
MKKKRSRSEIEEMHRLEERGVPVDWDAFYAPFNLTIFPVVSYGIDDGLLLDDFTIRIKELVFGAEFTCELEGILIFLHLLNPEVPAAPDRMSWSSKERRYRVQRTLDFDLWQSANRRERKKMLAATVIEILESIPVKRLSESKREELVEIVREAIRPKQK